MVFENVKQIIYFWSSLCSLYGTDGRFVKFQNVTGNNGVKTNLNVLNKTLFVGRTIVLSSRLRKPNTGR